jgi:hypothetical protein
MTTNQFLFQAGNTADLTGQGATTVKANVVAPSRVLLLLSTTAATNGAATVAFNTTVEDVNSEISAASLFTAKQAGLYQVSWSCCPGNVTWNAGGASFKTALRYNGGDYLIDPMAGQAAETQYVTSKGSGCIRLAIADTLSIQMTFSSAANTATLDGGYANYFSIVRVGI